MPDPINWSLALPYYAAACAGGYLAGSIPVGVLVTRLAGLGDVRAIGSGSIGATNVLRTGSRAAAALTLLLDVLKGLAAVLAAGRWGQDPAVIAALGAFLGHLFPVWLRFRGGKGVAVLIGVLLGLHWPAAVFFCAVWLAVAGLVRMSSAASLAAAALTPAFLYGMGRFQLAELSFALAVLAFVAHRANIARLLAGREPRLAGREPRIGRQPPPGRKAGGKSGGRSPREHEHDSS